MATQSDELGSPQASLGRHQQQSAVPAPRPSALVGGGYQGIDFLSAQEVYRFGLMAFAGDGQYALSQRAQARFLEGDVMKEGMNGGQTNVTRLGLVAPLFFHVVEEAANKHSIQV